MDTQVAAGGSDKCWLFPQPWEADSHGLHVGGTMGQTFERALKPLFERATGATVLFDNGWGEEIPKLLIAPPDQPPYDVMIVAPFQVYAVIRRNYFQKLDWSKIPNTRLFHPSALRNWVFDEGWGLTWPDALTYGHLQYSRYLSARRLESGAGSESRAISRELYVALHFVGRAVSGARGTVDC